MQVIGENLVHIIQNKSVTAVRVGIFRILLSDIAPHRHIVEGPVRVVEEDLKRKIEQIIVHIHSFFQSLLVLLLCQVRIKERQDFGPGIHVIVAGFIFFNRVRRTQSEKRAHIFFCHTRCDITDRIEFPVEIGDSEPGVRQTGKSARVRENPGIFIAHTPDMILRYAVGSKTDLVECIRL